MANKYLMGLDIGTDSVGWCVTDENNDVVKVSNKYLIGSRLFEQAEAKAERRQHRAARRRLARRARRIDLLQGLFAKEMSKVDPKFFIRLNNSFYQKEEKDSLLKDEYSIAQHDALFAGIGGYSDSQFHKEYPTIHHLILDLMKTTEKADIRLIYLACHFLIKYRGNFLHDNLKSISDQTEIKTQFQVAKDYLDKIHQNLGEEANLDCFTNDDNISKFIEITKKNGRINYLKAEFEKLFGVKTSYLKDVFYPLLAGSQVDVKKIFNYLDESEINLPENETKVKLDSESFDSILPSVAEIAGTDSKGYLLILAAKKIRDFETTNRLLGNATSLSEAMVNRYQTHKQDLKWLKQWVKSHSVEGEKPSLYDQVFHDTGDKKIANYASYIASDRGKSVKRCKYKDFTDFKNGDVVDVTGFASGTNFDQTAINIIMTSIAKNTSTTVVTISTKPQDFAAEGGTQDIAFTVANAGSNKVYAKVEGEGFSVPTGEVTGPVVLVTADANEGAAREATLTIYLAAEENGEAVAEASIKLSQLAPLSGDAKQVTFDYSVITSVDTTVDGISIACVKNDGNAPAYNAGSKELRIYRYNSFTLTASKGRIQKVELTFSAVDRMGYQISVDSGSYSDDSSSLTGTWLGDAASVKFTNNGDSENNVQARMKKIVVTYVEE